LLHLGGSAGDGAVDVLRVGEDEIVKLALAPGAADEPADEDAGHRRDQRRDDELRAAPAADLGIFDRLVVDDEAHLAGLRSGLSSREWVVGHRAGTAPWRRP
jgi:hypothetical protein